MNNKITRLRLTSVLLPAFILLGLTACSAPQPVEESTPVVQQEPVAAEPIEETVAAEEQPASDMMVPDYPERYVVVKGDTLWDISKRFLKDPWLWPSVWHINPNIRNPHLIYPGDVIIMYQVDGKPYLTLDGQAGLHPQGKKPPKKTEPIKPGLKVVKLSPSKRVSGIQKAISTIPMSAVRPFLDRPRVVTEEQVEDAPYIVSSYEGHLVSGTGNRIYARNLYDPLPSYNVVRPGKEYVDPETGDVLGYEVIYLADASLVKMGNEEVDEPATLIVTRSLREVLNNDILLPYEEQEEMYQFTPRSPEEQVKGQIVDVFNGVSQIGQHMVVVLNRGEADGLAPGHVLAIRQRGEVVNDSSRLLFSSVKLPDERAGLMMVFKTYKNISFALIMEASRALHVHDYFENP